VPDVICEQLARHQRLHASGFDGHRQYRQHRAFLAGSENEDQLHSCAQAADGADANAAVRFGSTH
jgi:hypothetical protein